MSQQKKIYTRIQMVDELLKMDKQIIHGGDIFKQAAAMIAETTPDCPVKFANGNPVVDLRGAGRHS